MRNEFDRIKRLPPYVFAEVNNLKAKLRSRGKDIDAACGQLANKFISN